MTNKNKQDKVLNNLLSFNYYSHLFMGLFCIVGGLLYNNINMTIIGCVGILCSFVQKINIAVLEIREKVLGGEK